MSRSNYDSSVNTWSPQGKIYQIEYAFEASKQGTCCVGVCSANSVVIVSARRNVSKLADMNSKILRIVDNSVASFSGIISDADYVLKKIREECKRWHYLHNEYPPYTFYCDVFHKLAHENIIVESRRPFGFVSLIGVYDAEGPHLIETMPDGDYQLYEAYSIGRNNQSARTYLEKIQPHLKNMSDDELLIHSLKAILCTFSESNVDASAENFEVVILDGINSFKQLSIEEVSYLYNKSLSTNE
uniref:Proteasome subunit alpha type n=1 Tax=Dermatophagoides pteronyssinus TaxID=6956 RepID=A0A6P6YDR1_DERPT|nr:proteasome subunit alpha type-1-like [Dermatophagoides pteronyssinus]